MSKPNLPRTPRPSNPRSVPLATTDVLPRPLPARPQPVRRDMRRRIIITLSLVLGLVFVTEAFGHGYLIRYGTKRHTGTSWGCGQGRSRTYFYDHWFRSDLYSTMGDKYARGVARQPDPSRHPHPKDWVTWIWVGPDEAGFKDQCIVRRECDTWTRWKKVASCNAEELGDGDSSTCPEATGDYTTEWTGTTTITTSAGFELEVNVYDVLKPFKEKVDPDCVEGIIY